MYDNIKYSYSQKLNGKKNQLKKVQVVKKVMLSLMARQSLPAVKSLKKAQQD